MVKVEYKSAVRKCELKISGHAESAPKGEDLVCAGVSTLFLTLCKALEENKQFLVKSDISKEAGNSHLTVEVKPRFERTVALIFYTILEGFELLSVLYPENITFSSGAL